MNNHRIRTVMNLKTMAGLVDSKRARTSSGALFEWAMLEAEKGRLMQEMERVERRANDIRGRMAEIGEKQTRLERFVKKPSDDQQLAEPSALPSFSASDKRLKQWRLTY